MRGIEFQIEGGYFDLLTQLVEDILLDKYIFFVAEDEIFRVKQVNLNFLQGFARIILLKFVMFRHTMSIL